MIKQLLTAALAVAVVTGPATAARADRPQYDCDFNSVQQENLTGDVYEGAIWGYLVHAADDSARIRCFVAVNGVEVDATDTEVGAGGVSVAYGRVSFTASETDHVSMCGEVTTAHGTLVDCFETAGPWFPPQEVFDLLDTVFTASAPAFAAVDGALCPRTGDLGREGTGVPGVVTFDPEDGDVYVADQLFWDCPPFELEV